MAIKVEIKNKQKYKGHADGMILSSSLIELSRKIKEEALINPFLVVDGQTEEGMTESDLDDEPSLPLDDSLETSDEIFSDEEIDEEPAEDVHYKDEVDKTYYIDMLEKRLPEEVLEEIMPIIADIKAIDKDLEVFLSEVLGEVTMDVSDIEPALSIRYIGEDPDVRLTDIPDIARISIDEDLKKELSKHVTGNAKMMEDYKDAVSLVFSIKWGQDNLMEVGRIIAQRQVGFFIAPDFMSAFKALKALTQDAVARSIGAKGINKGTMSKLIKKKFVDTKFGTVPMKIFFQPASKGTGISPKDKCLLITNYLGTKEGATDKEIMQHLNDQGVKISEKMVAYYRNNWIGEKRTRGRKKK